MPAIDLWGPIDPALWRQTPCIAGRVATEDDVVAGCAVFYVNGDSEHFEMDLPCCAIQTIEGGAEENVVVIQAEIGPSNVLVGVRYLDGGNGICSLDELRLLPAGLEL